MAKQPSLARFSRRVRYREVTVRVRELINEQKLWGGYLPAERELARLFGVHRGTVRKGLEMLEGQGLVVRRQGEGTWVLPQQERRPDRRGSARVAVASFMRHPTEDYIAQIVTGLTHGAGEGDWSVRFFDRMGATECRGAFLAALRAGEVDGLILLGVTDRGFIEEVLRRWNGPAVLVDHYFPDLPLTSVMDDSSGGARQATEHLLSLGHRRIGYIGPRRRAVNPWRHEGYSVALRAAGIEPDEGLVIGSPSNFEGGLGAARELLSRPEPPTAVLVSGDIRAWGAWRAAEERGLKVGRDFAVVGYGDAIPGSRETLSSVRIDMQHLGWLAARELEDLLAGRVKPGRLVLEPVELVVRDSSRDARVGAGQTAKE